MDTKYLSYILTIAKKENMTKAAEELFVSQSTLSPVSYTHLDVYKRQGIFNNHKSCQQFGDAGRNLLLVYVLGKQHGPGIHIHDNACL